MVYALSSILAIGLGIDLILQLFRMRIKRFISLEPQQIRNHPHTDMGSIYLGGDKQGWLLMFEKKFLPVTSAYAPCAFRHDENPPASFNRKTKSIR